jgi:energy-coupling factor transporter ATP-binding protein EcfA2
VDPDVLILDEVLAVGDQRFRAKAREAMQELLNRDVALIFISHNMQQVQGITSSALWLDRGRMKDLGQSSLICARYVNGSAQSTGKHLGVPIEISRSLKLVSLDSIEVVRGGVSEDPILTIDEKESDRRVEITLCFTVRKSFGEEECYFILAVGSGERYHAHALLDDRIPCVMGESFVRTFQVDFSAFHQGAYTLLVQLFPRRGVVGMLYGATVLQVTIGPEGERHGDGAAGISIGADLGQVALSAKLFPGGVPARP